MIRLKFTAVIVALALTAVACQPSSSAATPTLVSTEVPPPLSTATETLVPELSATPEMTPAFTATVSAPARPEEAIFIQEPGPGSQVTSPIRVAGVAEPTFEQNLVVRIVLDDGTQLTEVPTTIQSDVGQRGNFEVEVPLSLDMQRNIFIQVYASSARDGGITHLSSTGVSFAPGGPENIVARETHPEQIAIIQPQTAETITGGVVHVEGFGLASFEQSLLIEVLDAEGNIVGMQPIIVQAPDLGQPGPFSADVAYTVSAPGPGRVVVRDISPAFGGDTHLSSVEVTLEP